MTCMLLSFLLHAQSVKKSTKDTAKYRANDRLRTTGPKDGWGDSVNTKNTSIKAKADATPARRKGDARKKKN